MLGSLEMAVGVLIWVGVLWDGFATIVLPRTLAPMRRLSGRFYWWSWRFWASAGWRIKHPVTRLTFLSIYGPFSVMALLALWGGLIILASTLVFHGLGPRFHSTTGPVDFSALLYMSGSTFLTLGLGDVTSSDPFGRLFILLEAASGYVFLALIITYMPLLDQSYGLREVGNLLIHSRAGRPPGALRLLSRYAGADRSEVLRSNLREAERWMAETLQSHTSHPVLSFYRAQRLGQSWLVSVATVLDSSALLIVGGVGMPAAQAHLTYRTGLRLLEDLTAALGLKADPNCPSRLNEVDLPALAAALDASALGVTLEPEKARELLRIVHKYDMYLVKLADWLVIPLPAWITPANLSPDLDYASEPDGLYD